MYFRPWEISRQIQLQKDPKGLERWRPYYTFGTNYPVHSRLRTRDYTQKQNYLGGLIFWTRYGSRLYYKTIKCEKNSAFCSVTTYNPAVASFTEQLYEKMTSNPSFTKRNIQNTNAYLLNILVRSETLCSRITLYRACQGTQQVFMRECSVLRFNRLTFYIPFFTKKVPLLYTF